jgi:glycosyltransferase involved in cell wall biosynthesis
MASAHSKTRILLFIGSLRSGGKERRLIELLTYLKNNAEFEFLVVLTQNIIHYPAFYKLDIPCQVIEKKWNRYDPTVPYYFYKICKEFKPDLIHSWGSMQSFYTIPAVVLQNIPLVNSQITAAPPDYRKWSFFGLIDQVNFFFSKVILANSQAGLDVYKPPRHKSRVIYNGINMSRFANLPDADLVKQKYNIHTPYAVVMAASYSPQKDYAMFYAVADRVTRLRDDITFIGVGGHDDSPEYKRLLKLSALNDRIIFPGRINDVEALVNACTIGLLFSNILVHGEGISNSIMEYMALAKPVIANDAGGTREILKHNRNGYLVQNESADEVADLVLELIDNPEKREAFGRASKQIIEETFSLNSMGNAFESVYREVVALKNIEVPA